MVLVNMDVDYFVMFEAETGTSLHTYIAMDDVSFTHVSVTHGSCSATQKCLKTVNL